jgi:hypothetical protein
MFSQRELNCDSLICWWCCARSWNWALCYLTWVSCLNFCQVQTRWQEKIVEMFIHWEKHSKDFCFQFRERIKIWNCKNNFSHQKTKITHCKEYRGRKFHTDKMEKSWGIFKHLHSVAISNGSPKGTIFCLGLDTHTHTHTHTFSLKMGRKWKWWIQWLPMCYKILWNPPLCVCVSKLS